MTLQTRQTVSGAVHNIKGRHTGGVLRWPKSASVPIQADGALLFDRPRQRRRLRSQL